MMAAADAPGGDLRQVNLDFVPSCLADFLFPYGEVLSRARHFGVVREHSLSVGVVGDEFVPFPSDGGMLHYHKFGAGACRRNRLLSCSVENPSSSLSTMNVPGGSRNALLSASRIPVHVSLVFCQSALSPVWT